MSNANRPTARMFLAAALLLGSAMPMVPALVTSCLADDRDRWEKFPDGSTGKVGEYKGVKDTPIAAYIRKPKGDGPFPAVVLIHGGGESAQGTYALGRMNAAPTATFLAQGWAVFSIDFRPGSPFQPIEWDDACRAVATLRAMPFIDAKRIAMMGGSHGGYNTARAASRCDLSCAVPCAPAAIDLVEVAKAKAAGFKLSPNLERVLANPPASNAPGAFEEAGKVRCPLLLISGRNDSSSPPSVMEAYAAKLRAAGKEVELYLPDNGPHGFYFGRPAIPETDEAARRAVAFIAKHFGVAAKAVAAASSQAKPAPNRRRADSPASNSTPDGRSARLFQRLDANGDGKIAGEEAASEPGRRFLRMFDKNGDGIVTREEASGQNSSSAAPPVAPKDPSQAPPKAALTPARGQGALTQMNSFRSAALNADLPYALYLPPSYEKDKQRRYPVIFWLHGGGGGPGDCWKFVEVTDAAIKAGQCPEMLIVGVDGRSRGAARVGSQYSDWKDGSLPMETAIIKDLLPHIDATYRTLGTREGRAVEGFSMGGHGALHLAFRHPDLFGAVTALGPALIMPGDGGNRVQEVYKNGAYKGDEAYWREHDPLTLAEKNAAALRGKMFIRLITGEVEGNFTHRRTVELSAKLKVLGIEHEFIRPGETGHNYAKVYEAMPTGYEFYVKAFGKLTLKDKEPPLPPAKDPKEEKPPDRPLAKQADPAPLVCYDAANFPRDAVRRAQPVEPFEIMDGCYYVGNTQVSAHLLKTSDGLILIDSTMPHQVGWVLESICKLGLKPSDVKVVIGSHAAIDHTGGHWYFQKHFGAQTWLHELDVPGAMSAKCVDGAKVDLTQVQMFMAYPPFNTDRALKDGETIKWGGRTLVVHHTPTGTPGTITLEIPLRDKSGKMLRAAIFGALAPRMSGFEDSIQRLKNRPIDVWLAVHPEQNNTLEKARKLNEGTGPNPFIDPEGWKKFLDRIITRGKGRNTP